MLVVLLFTLTWNLLFLSRMKILLLISWLSLIQINMAWSKDLLPLTHLDQDESLTVHTVTALAEDAYGRIWIGTRQGLHQWDGRNMERVGGVNGAVLYLEERKQMVYCVTINAIHKIDSRSGEVQTQSFVKAEYYQCLSTDSLIILKNSLEPDILIFDRDLKRIKTSGELFTPKLKLAMEQSSVAFGSHSLTVFNHNTLLYGKDTVEVDGGLLTAPLGGQGRQVFVGSQHGVLVLTESNGELHRDTLLQRERIECMLLDRNQNLWVGTSDRGVFMIHQNALSNTYYRIVSEEGEAAICWSFIPVEGQLYSATSIGLINLDSDQPDWLENITRGTYCYSAIEGDGFVLVGTPLKGILKASPGNLSTVYFNQQDGLDNTIIQFVKNEQGFLVLTKRAFIQLDPMGNFLFRKPHDPENQAWYLMGIQPTTEGYLAAGTTGVLKYNKQLEILKTYQASEARVFSMATRHKDEWWLTSMDGGLYRLINDSLHKTDFEDQFLFGAVSKEEGLWLSAFNSVYQLSGDHTIPYGFENGFPIKEYNQAGIHLTGAGELLFAGVGGVFRFDPSTNQDLILPTWFIHWNEKVLEPEGKVDLNYDQSQVVLQVKAIMQSDQNRFDCAYFHNGSWWSIDAHSQLNLDLDYGVSEVRFRVRNKITGEENVHSVLFQRDLPFWLTWWFRGLIILGVGIGLVGFYFLIKYQRTRKLLKEESKARQVTQERLRISRELHDNIGARLTHIISSLDIQLYKNKEGAEGIEKINDFARETMTQLRETIWAVGDSTIFFSELAARIEQYTAQVDRMSAVSFLFDNKTAQDFELNSVQTINFYRIVQEAINNALKYSQAKNITVLLLQKAQEQQIIIHDNGKGFDAKKSAAGTGIEGMKRRAQEAGGSCEVKSDIGKGTTVSVKFKWE